MEIVAHYYRGKIKAKYREQMDVQHGMGTTKAANDAVYEVRRSKARERSEARGLKTGW